MNKGISFYLGGRLFAKLSSQQGDVELKHHGLGFRLPFAYTSTTHSCYPFGCLSGSIIY